MAVAGRVDLWVNNAGVAPERRLDLLETTPESWDRVLDTNLRGPFFLTQSVARAMIEMQSAGTVPEPQIVFITSISSRFASVTRGEYCVAKAGLSMVAQLFAARLAGQGIRVYEVRPGLIDTDMTRAVRAAYDERIAAGLVPIGRWGTAEDVGRAVARDRRRRARVLHRRRHRHRRRAQPADPLSQLANADGLAPGVTPSDPAAITYGGRAQAPFARPTRRPGLSHRRRSTVRWGRSIEPSRAPGPPALPVIGEGRLRYPSTLSTTPTTRTTAHGPSDSTPEIDGSRRRGCSSCLGMSRVEACINGRRLPAPRFLGPQGCR